MKRRPLKLLMTILLMSCCNAFAQQTHRLTLDKSIEIAKEKSYTMLILREDVRIAEYNLKSATSRLKTHVSMTLSLPEFSNTVQQKADSTGIFFPVKKLTWSSGLTINQPLPTDGNIFIQSGLSSYQDFFAGTRSGYLNTRIGFQQPLDALYGYNEIRSNLKTYRLQYERSNKQLKRTELELVYNVSAAFYQLLSLQKSTEIALLDLNRQQEASKISKNKYAAGLIREVDDLQMEVDLAAAQSAYDMALLSQNEANRSFLELLGIDLNDSVILDSSMDYQPVAVDEQRAVELALANRLEIRESEIVQEIQKIAIKRQKASGMIRGNLNAYFEKAGLASPSGAYNLAGTITDSYGDFLNRPYSYGVGFTITVPIFDWGENRALVRAAQANLKEIEYQRTQTERNIETEVRNLVNKISTNLKRLQNLEKNVAVAEKSFAITLQRYTDGDIDSQSLALERNRLNTAYSSHLDAYITYQLSLANLMRQTYFNFLTGEGIE